MGDKINLTLDVRTLQGKKAARLRADGIVPGVVYGHGFDPILVQAEYNVLNHVVHRAGKHTPVHLTVDGKKKIALIKDIERNAVKGRMQHVSFHAVKANEVVTAEIPVHLVGVGESEAEKAGLIVLQDIESVEVKAKPADLPESLELSITGLAAAGDRLTLADVKLPADVVFADNEQDLDLVVANVYEPAALEAANEAAAGDAEPDTEPEIEDEEVADDAKETKEEK